MAASSAAPAARPLQVELAILSREGGRGYNEDACGHWHGDDHLCCVVADGAGGMGGGEVASRLAVRHIIEQASEAPLSGVDDVRDLLVDTNAHVRRHQRESDALENMHTTVVALFVDLARGEALWGHAGDSRLYLIRDGRIAVQTHDHSLVQSLIDAGVLGPEQTRLHPNRSELLSALGTAPENLLVSTVDAPWKLAPGDAFLLCTDGLWEYVDEAEMTSTLGDAPDAQVWLTRLETLVLEHAQARGAREHDNFSAVGVWFRMDGAPAAARRSG
jgi:serine/threonine protein phosphatase PrpC